MTLNIRHWLPASAVTPETVRDPISQGVAQWNKRWFRDPFATVTGLKMASGAARNENDEGGWRQYRSLLAIRGEGATLARLTDRAVDMETTGLHLTEGDQVLLKALERRMIEDLVVALETALGLSGAAAVGGQKIRDPLVDGGGILGNLTDPAGRDILSFAIPGHAFVPYIKGSLGTPAAGLEAVQSPLGALGKVPIAIEALIGSAELTLAELADLAVGDVLVLDRTLDDAIEVGVAETNRVFAQARLIQSDDGMALEFKV